MVNSASLFETICFLIQAGPCVVPAGHCRSQGFMQHTTPEVALSRTRKDPEGSLASSGSREVGILSASLGLQSKKSHESPLRTNQVHLESQIDSLA